MLVVLKFKKASVHNEKQPPEVIKKAVLKHFSILTGKRLCWSLYLIKLRTFRTVVRNVDQISITNLIMQDFCISA